MLLVWSNFNQIFTDGSRDPVTRRVGFGLYIPHVQQRECHRLPDGLSVFTAELVGLLWALKWVETSKEERVVICSDSMSALMVLEGGEGAKARPDIVSEILMVVYRLERQGCSVGFLWVPAHVGVEGNEVADAMAKEALEQQCVGVRIALGQFEGRSLIKDFILGKWQEEWDKDIRGRHYHQIQRSVRGHCIGGESRRDQIIITRLRLGHCGLAKNLLTIGKHPDGLCQYCKKNGVCVACADGMWTIR